MVSAKLRAVNTQAADAPECDGGDSAQPSNQHHPIVAEAVNQTAQAKKAFSKSSGVQSDKTRLSGSRTMETIMVCKMCFEMQTQSQGSQSSATPSVAAGEAFCSSSSSNTSRESVPYSFDKKNI